MSEIQKALTVCRLANVDRPDELRMNLATATALARECHFDPEVTRWAMSPPCTAFGVPVTIYANIPDGIVVLWSTLTDAPWLTPQSLTALAAAPTPQQ